jgi:hypothetical protein
MVGFCDHSNEHSGYIKCREYLRLQEPGYLTRYSDSLRAGRSCVQIPAGARDCFLYNRPYRLCPIFNGYRRSFLGYSGRGVTTTLLHPVPTLRMCGAIRLLPLYAIMTWTGTQLFLSWPHEQLLDSQEEFSVHNLMAKDDLSEGDKKV